MYLNSRTSSDPKLEISRVVAEMNVSDLGDLRLGERSGTGRERKGQQHKTRSARRLFFGAAHLDSLAAPARTVSKLSPNLEYAKISLEVADANTLCRSKDGSKHPPNAPVLLVVPAAQLRQDEAPGLGLYVPTPQSAQAVESSVPLNWPALHSSHPLPGARKVHDTPTSKSWPYWCVLLPAGMKDVHDSRVGSGPAQVSR